VVIFLPHSTVERFGADHIDGKIRYIPDMMAGRTWYLVKDKQSVEIS
jgi:hypothetical protein